MITEDLILYIQAQRRKNVSDNIIRARLSGALWHADDIDEAFRKLAPQPVPKVARPIEATPVVVKQVPAPLPLPIQQLIELKPVIHNNPFTQITPEPTKSVTKGTQIEVRNEELMPSLKPKVVIVPTPPTFPKSIPKDAILHSYPQELSSAAEANQVSIKRTRNSLLKVLVVILIIIGIGGATFAFARGYIKLPSINLPFIKKDPKLLLLKAPIVLDGLKSYKIDTTATISMPLVADITSGLWSGESVSSIDKDSVTVSAKGYVNNAMPAPTFDYQATISSTLLPDVIISDLKYSNGTTYFTTPDLSRILGANAPSASTVALSPDAPIDSFVTLLPNYMQNVVEKINLNKVLSTIVPSYVNQETASILKDFITSGSVVEQTPEDIHGVPTYHYELTAPRQATKEFLQKFIGIYTLSLSPGEQTRLNDKLGGTKMESFEIWIGKNDSNIHQYKFVLTSPLSQIISLEDKGIAGSNVSMTWQTSYYDFDVPNTIALPTDAINMTDFLRKVNDMKIKNNISSFSNVAVSMKNAIGKYGTRNNPTGSCTNPNPSSLFSPTGHSKGANTAVGTVAGIMNRLLNTTNGALTCYSTPDAWALSAPLPTDPTHSFCADSTGTTTILEAPLKGTICK